MKFPEHYSENESRDPELRERELLSALPEFIAHAKKNSPAYAEILRQTDPRDITTRQALAELPVVNKSDLIGLQEKNPPVWRLRRLFRGRSAAACFSVAGANCGMRLRQTGGLEDRARFSRGGFSAGDAGAQQFFIPLHAGGRNV